MLTHPLLTSRKIEHGFGLRGEREPAGVLRPQQVHGTHVVTAAECRGKPSPEADAVVSNEAGVSVAVVTADCVPILLATDDGRSVAAVHAGWRGLAAGVVTQSLAALRQHHSSGVQLVAAIGPHIGPCCYEVDAPVIDAMLQAFGRDAEPALQRARRGHAQLDLGMLVTYALEREGVHRCAIGRVRDACTRCDAIRFHSYRRDGPRSGRLLHHIAARAGPQPRES